MTKFSTNCGLTFLLGNRCSASLRSSGKNPFSSHLLMRKVNSILAGVSPFWIFLLEDKFSISFFVSSRVLSYDVNVNFPINSNFLIMCTLIRENEMYFGKQKLPSVCFPVFAYGKLFPSIILYHLNICYLEQLQGHHYIVCQPLLDDTLCMQKTTKKGSI